MKYNPTQKLADMERVPVEYLPDRLDELLERIEKENVGFVITRDGEDRYVLLPACWVEAEVSDILDIAPDLLQQVMKVAAELNITLDEMIHQFFLWCTDPETTSEAKEVLDLDPNEPI